jgi:hypothetical protein
MLVSSFVTSLSNRKRFQIPFTSLTNISATFAITHQPIYILMKATFYRITFIGCLLALAYCSPKKTNDHDHETHDGHEHLHEAKEPSPNATLYDEVMEVHDAVMPKMDDLYKLKRKLQNQLESTTDLTDAKKEELTNTIQLIDSASNGMMVWMREFKPASPSMEEEEEREYLENEMEKINKVKSDMERAIEKAQQEL